jgi:ABC-type polysaccharide/polyol phosphate transport system ATPase subunit
MKDSLIVVEAKIALDENLTLPENGYVIGITKQTSGKKTDKVKVSAFIVGTKLLASSLFDQEIQVESMKMRPWYKLQYLEFVAEFSELSNYIRTNIKTVVAATPIEEEDSAND